MNLSFRALRRQESQDPVTSLVRPMRLNFLVSQPKSRLCFSSTTRYAELTFVPESAYMLRRVERHGRELIEGQSPWSIRQSTIYNRFTIESGSKDDTRGLNPVFMLMSPSENARNQISSLLKVDVTLRRPFSPSHIHLIFVADSLKGWKDYLTWLDTEVKCQVRRSFLALNPPK